MSEYPGLLWTVIKLIFQSYGPWKKRYDDNY